jgi:hypothetical protein
MITAKTVMTNRKQLSTASRIEAIDWIKVATDLEAQGCGVIKDWAIRAGMSRARGAINSAAAW